MGFLYGDQHLLADLALKNIIAMGHKASSVNNIETFSRPFGNAILPVAGYARCIFDNGFPLFKKPVEQGAFAHIRPAYYRYCKTHIRYLNLVLNTRIPSGKCRFPSILAAL
jgi:hypothetical protein